MLACLYTGLLLGLQYDLTRPFCLLHTALADGLFWCCACFTMLQALYAINNLSLRLFVFVFFALGFGLWRLSFSPLLRAFGRLLRRFFGRTFAVLWEFLR